MSHHTFKGVCIQHQDILVLSFYFLNGELLRKAFRKQYAKQRRRTNARKSRKHPKPKR